MKGDPFMVRYACSFKQAQNTAIYGLVRRWQGPFQRITWCQTKWVFEKLLWREP